MQAAGSKEVIEKSVEIQDLEREIRKGEGYHCTAYIITGKYKV